MRNGFWAGSSEKLVDLHDFDACFVADHKDPALVALEVRHESTHLAQ